MKRFVINGNHHLDVTQIENMTYEEFGLRRHAELPKSLFKYFSNVPSEGNNFSHQALESNSVYMQSPKCYNDPYDSYLKINSNEYYLSVVKFYLDLANVTYSKDDGYGYLFTKLVEYVRVKLLPFRQELFDGDFLGLINPAEFDNKNQVHLTCALFESQIKGSLLRDSEVWTDFERAVEFALKEGLKSAQEYAYSTFKIACFTKRKDNMLMWSHYANNHEGFCVEYDVEGEYDPSNSTCLNLFPVIYCNYLSDVSKEVIQNNLGKLDNQVLMGLYSKCLLRKTLDWCYEEEWRLIGVDRKAHLEKFFKIKKVYLGCKMSKKDQAEIIDFCSKNKIQCVSMEIDDLEYKMVESEIDI